MEKLSFGDKGTKVFAGVARPYGIAALACAHVSSAVCDRLASAASNPNISSAEGLDSSGCLTQLIPASSNPFYLSHELQN